MESLCQCKRGFLVLQDCRANAVSTCSVCNRVMCNEHQASAAKITCVECLGKTALQTDTSPRHGTEYAYLFRHRYYRGVKHGPTYWGSNANDPYYNDYDFRSFDTPLTGNDPLDGARTDGDDATMDEELDISQLARDWFDS